MYKQISSDERDLICLWHGQGISNTEIGKRLKRDKTTIGREIKRNLSESGYYVAISAQAQVDKRKVVARSRHPLKNKALFAYIIKKLQSGWSPDLIAGRLRKKYKRSVVSPETIYTFIYSAHPRAKELALWEYLPKHKKKRTRKFGRKTQKVHIPGRISIHDRPTEIDKRKSVGHWEGDTMEGKAHKNGLHVELERVTRLVFAKKISKIDSLETLKAQRGIFAAIPVNLKRSVTLDNGKENYLHQDLNSLGIKTYFADPYSAWQKGSVENSISIIRRYFPKKTDLTNVTQSEIDEVVWEINSRPRKILNYSTPQEMYNNHIKGCTST